MRNAASFAELLDARLGCTDVPPPPRAWSGRAATAALFIFDIPAPAVRPAAPPDMPLTALERRSLLALNALGAGLDGAITAATLKRAFRRLAQRYHPDRHPGSSPAEQRRLAQLFADATAHYRVLSGAV